MAEPPEPIEPNGPEPPPAPLICQSCGMPMGRKEDFGTNAKGGRNREYCAHCFQNGKFTNPDMTMEQMIEHMVSMGAKMKMSEDQVRKIASQMLPRLKRWKK